MKKRSETPTLVEDLGAIAGLYRTVFWMMGQRIQRGRNWEERLADDALKVQSLEKDETAARPHAHN